MGDEGGTRAEADGPSEESGAFRLLRERQRIETELRGAVEAPEGIPRDQIEPGRMLDLVAGLEQTRGAMNRVMRSPEMLRKDIELTEKARAIAGARRPEESDTARCGVP